MLALDAEPRRDARFGVAPQSSQTKSRLAEHAITVSSGTNEASSHAHAIKGFWHSASDFRRFRSPAYSQVLTLATTKQIVRLGLY